MIIDRLDNLGSYASLNAGFEKVQAFVAANDLSALPEGRCEIDGDNVFAIVARADSVGPDEARLEIHRKYIDIQAILAGVDEIGWKPLADCTSPADEYDADKDLQFFSDESEIWVAVEPGRFAALFPEDAHAPMGGSGQVHKLVFKIAVS